MSAKKEIAIIGGGIAGLTFARCLPSDKYNIHIFEKNGSFGEIGAAISVFPNALCVLEELGLLNEVLANSGQIQKIFFKDSHGAVLSKSEPTGEYPVICIHRANLHRILLNNIHAQLYNDFELRTIFQEENGRVHLIFENGEERFYDAVIGADGLHSRVRQYVLNDGKPIFRGYNIWRGVVESDFEAGYGSETFGRGKRVGIVPIKENMYGWWATCNENFLEDDRPEETKDKLKRLFGSWHDPIPELIQNTENILKNSLVDRVPKKGWTKGNVTLLGDAAHPTTPNLGQGGCMAMEGAYILANSLLKYGITKKAFERYEELQFPRSKMIVQESLRFGKIGQVSNPFLATVRNIAFKAMPSSISIKMFDKFFSYKVTQIGI